jgi:hypothetical protein
MRNDFVAFILTHGRPDKIHTIDALRKAGYTGKIILVIDNEDKTADRYYELYGRDSVVMFDKLKKSTEFDTIDRGTDRRAIVYARNACFDIAEDLGYKYFLELDDDYTNFRQRFIKDNGEFGSWYLRDFDAVVDVMINFLETSGALTVAFAQTGDFIGGPSSKVFRDRLARKAMNSFFCKTENRFDFIGRINEDVNTYVNLGSKGNLFFTVADMSLDQTQTQANSGGMTELYSSTGTYTKTFFTVISNPSCVKVCTVGVQHPRIHHRIDWDTAVPKIISGKYKKVTKEDKDK